MTTEIRKGWTDAELYEFAATQLYELGDEGLIVRPLGISEKRFERILSDVLFDRNPNPAPEPLMPPARRCDGCIEEIRKVLDLAKREPAHSPTEDALIDAVEMLLELVAERISDAPASLTHSGAESAHSGKQNTADESELLPTQLEEKK